MSLSAAELAFLADAGLTLAQVVEFAALRVDAPKARTANAERQARFRERHSVTNNVTVTPQNNETLSPSPLVPPFDKEIPPTPPKEIKSPPIIPPTTGLDCAADWPANAEVIEIIIAEAGIRLTSAETWHLRSAGVVALWRHNGFSFWDEVLPTIKALVDGGAKIKSWAYFTDAIAECRANRLKPIPIPEPRQSHERRNPNYKTAGERNQDSTVRVFGAIFGSSSDGEAEPVRDVG